VRLASTGALVKATGGEVTMLNQNRVRRKLEVMERHQQCPVMEMVEMDEPKSVKFTFDSMLDVYKPWGVLRMSSLSCWIR
jgi:hypothetical protein